MRHDFSIPLVVGLALAAVVFAIFVDSCADWLCTEAGESIQDISSQSHRKTARASIKRGHANSCQ